MTTKVLGRDLLKAVSESTGITNIRRVVIDAPLNDVAIMTVERLVGSAEVDHIVGAINGLSLSCSTTVQVSPSLRVTFEV